MNIKTRFVLNRSVFRNQVLKDNGDAGIVAAIKPHVEAVAPAGTTVKVSYGPSRVRIRIVDETPDAADRESKNGELSRALNRLKV